MSFTLAQLKTAIQDYTDNSETSFVTHLPDFIKASEEKIFKKVDFTHPYYDQNALQYQNQLETIQNKKNILFCGSYFGYGFHEDGIKSSLDMLKSIND